MLFGYPVGATSNNWLHECIQEVLRHCHEAANRGGAIDAWPAILPETHRDRLKRFTSLRDAVREYFTALCGLSSSDRARVASAMVDQNQIVGLLDGTADCETLEQLPVGIVPAIQQLFEVAFRMLTDVGLRDACYREIYHRIPAKVCPFCGYEAFDAPEAPREDFDHYLARRWYPFAAASLRNLVPMGMRCNERYKIGVNIIRRDDGSRRKAWDPYGGSFVRIDVQKNDLLELPSEGQPTKWVINFVPNNEEAATWDAVFAIRERYGRDVLDAYFLEWVREFGAYCRIGKRPSASVAQITTTVREYADLMEFGGIKERYFLRAAVFRMLHKRCVQGEADVINFLLSVATSP